MTQPSDKESPFLPDGRRWLWSANSLDAAQTCDRKYYYSSVLGLVKNDKSADLLYGGWYSAACERYHTRRAAGESHEHAVEAVVYAALCETWNYETNEPWQSGHNFKTRETLIRSIVWYLDTYEHDPCATIILDSGKPATELDFRFQLADDMWLRGRIDRLVSYAGDPYVQDQKTTGSTIGSYYFKRYNPNTQMSLYAAAAEVIWHMPVKGVMIDAAQIAVGFTRFERGFTFRTPEQTDEWLSSAEYHIKRNWNAAEAAWPQNDAACQKYGGCEFLDVCSKSPQVQKEYLATGYSQRIMT